MGKCDAFTRIWQMKSTLTLAMIPHLLLLFNIPWGNWRQGYNYAGVTKSHFELVCGHPKNSNVH